MKTLKPQEVFDYLHDAFKYIAMDDNLEWCAFQSMPAQGMNVWNMQLNDDGYRNISANDTFSLRIDYTGDWKDSLHCREPDYIREHRDEWEKPIMERAAYLLLHERIKLLEEKIPKCTSCIFHYPSDLCEKCAKKFKEEFALAKTVIGPSKCMDCHEQNNSIGMRCYSCYVKNQTLPEHLRRD